MKKTKKSKNYIKKIKEEYPNAYEPWTSENDNLLEKLFKEGKNISELSEIFRRKPGAIRSRLKKLLLIDI